MLITSLISGNEDNLKVALDDRIHEPYRFKLMPEIEKIEKIIDDSKAIGHYLSGSGSTIIVVLKSENESSEEEIREGLEKLTNSYQVKRLDIDKKGAFLI